MYALPRKARKRLRKPGVENHCGGRNTDEMNSARWTSEDLTALKSKRLDAKVKTRPKGESANRMTANILRAINMQPGCVAYRINNVGVWDAEKQIYRKGNTQKGIFDISAVIRGRAAWIEIKAGRDKASREQLIFKQEIETAGGLAFIAYSTDEFLKWFTEILKQ